MPFLERPWGRMAYRVREGSEPALVLVHGSFCDTEDWNRLAPHLPAGQALVMCDLRGHGQSDVPPAPEQIVFDGMAADLVALVDALGLDRPVLVGHSLGGMLALRFGERAPERTRGLVPIEGWTRLGIPWAARTEMYGDMPAHLVEYVEEKKARTVARWPEGFQDAFIQSVRAADAWEMLLQTDLPILEVYGDRGKPRPPRADLLIPDRPNIALVWVEGAAHYLHISHPEAIGHAVSAWFEAHGSFRSDVY